MNDCLYTKYKKEVANSNLPYLNTLLLDYCPNTGSTGQLVFRIKIESGHEVKITFKQAVHAGSGTGTLVTEFTLNTNINKSFYFDVSTLGTDKIEDFVKIEGDIYNIIGLGAEYVNEFIRFGNSAKNNFESQLYNSALKTLVLNIDKLKYAPSSAKYAIVDTNATSQSSQIGLDVNVPFEYLYFAFITSAAPFIKLNDITKQNTSIKYINPMCAGSILDLPKNILTLSSSSAYLTGTIEEFVARMRSEGRTSGYLSFNGPSTTWVVKYNNKTIPQQVADSVIPVVSNVAYLSWDASSITWLDSKPSAFDNYVPSKSLDWALDNL